MLYEYKEIFKSVKSVKELELIINKNGNNDGVTRLIKTQEFFSHSYVQSN